MQPSSIPDDLRRFILLRIPSIPYLEALLLMRDNPQQAWDGDALARRLYLGNQVCDDLLRQLLVAGIIERHGGADGPSSFRYAPHPPELARMLDRVAQVYARHLVEVSTLIHSKTHNKARVFADAFVWRKDK